MPLSATKVFFQTIFDATDDSVSSPLVSEESNESYFPAWAENSTYSYNCLDMVFPSDESLLEAMIGPEKICEDLHHKYYFILELSKIETFEFHVRLVEGIDQPVNPLPK